jgi:hypothetical protein
MAGICPQIDADWQGGRMTVADRTMAWAVFFLIYFPPQAAYPPEMEKRGHQ